MNRIVAFLAILALSVALCGCNGENMPLQPTESLWVEDVEPTEAYDWMAGESPVSTLRIGKVRGGLSGDPHAVSPTGVYYLYGAMSQTDTFVLYSDLGSNQFVKLCGRPDCLHKGEDCNAYVSNGGDICYYQGYIYVFGHSVELVGDTFVTITKIYRMDLDGSDRVEITVLSDFAQQLAGEGGLGSVSLFFVSDGYCWISVDTWAATEDKGLERQPTRYFTYKVDGSEGDPKETTTNGMPLYNCDDVLLTLTNESKYGSEKGAYWDWDHETGTKTYLTDHPGEPGWYGAEAGYFMRGGEFVRLDYATRTEEVLLDTGLEGDYYANCFPDCIVISNYAEQKEGEDYDRTLYFYNWDLQLVDSVVFPHEIGWSVSQAIVAETSQQIIFNPNISPACPMYYINKSEIGTGELKIHEYKLPELPHMEG